MHIRLPIRWTVSSLLLVASAACGGDSSKPAKDSGTDAVNGESCEDGKQNGDESDVDCGGSCGPCSEGQQCKASEDCGAELGCSSKTNSCAQGAKLGFSLSTPEGVVPVIVTATSSASPGSSGAAIKAVRYDWGDGGGFVEGDSHKYRKGGTFKVRQQVEDADGVTVTQDEANAQTVTIEDFEPVRFSGNDKHEQVTVSGFGYEAGIKTDKAEAHGVRSTGTVTPGSGVFYFESQSLVPVGDDDFSSIGVATAAVALDKFVAADQRPMGAAQSFGVYGNGAIPHTGGTCSGAMVTATDPGVVHFERGIKRFGFVVDYSGTNPTVYILAKAAEKLELLRSCSLVVTAPLHVMYAARRSTLGPQVRINTGADVTNAPFFFKPEEVKAALTEAKADAAAAAVTFGFGKTRTPMEDKAPVLNVPTAEVAATLNTPVTVMGSATDAEDGDLTKDIVWTDLSANFFERDKNSSTGASYTFTPTRIGRYAIEARVSDLDEITTTKLVIVNVAGGVETTPVANVRLQPAACEVETDCVEVINNGLGIRRRGGLKNGVIANQAIYRGQFWYFEAHRNGPEANLGAGLVVAGGDITPYEDDLVPWSISVVMQTGIWRNLNSVHGYDRTGVNHYGIAVDYRGEHPKVYMFLGAVPTLGTPAPARLEHVMELTEVWGPLYPMLYGTMGGTMGAENTTATINFGATPFSFNNIPALLTEKGVTGVPAALRWGN